MYGAGGFYRREAPANHFRTSVTASPHFADAILAAVRRSGLDTVVDVGAGRGELLTALHSLDPTLTLLGVEVAPRPGHLPAAVAWSASLPESVEGLVLANEWLDNVPCHVVEVDEGLVPRIVHVDPATGSEELGAPLDSAGVPPSLAAWCATWWPLHDAGPGSRAEVGTTRDAAWADVVGRVQIGLAIAVDYGHTRRTRPVAGSLRSYREGREVDVLPDGSCDVTASVAVDAVAAAVDGVQLSQGAALRALGLDARRPPLSVATSEPASYLAELGRAAAVGELLAPGGLGDFTWVVTRRGVDSPFATAT